MRRIDADAVYQELRKRKAKFSGHRDLHNAAVCAGINEAISVIGAATTIDAEPVVRCKDCRYSKVVPLRIGDFNDVRICSVRIYGGGDNSVEDDGFCSDGERREEPT